MKERLISILRRSLAPADRDWLDAILAELPEIDGLAAKSQWLVGAAPVALGGLLSSLTRERHVWLVSVVLGAVVAYVDLTSASRLPMALLVASVAGLLGFVAPRWPWRWALVLTACVPAAVWLGYLGPYKYDRFDVFYPVPPALLIAVAASWFRGRLSASRRLA